MRSSRIRTVRMLNFFLGGGGWCIFPTGVHISGGAYFQQGVYPSAPPFIGYNPDWWIPLDALPPSCGQTDICENITFSQLRLRAVNITRAIHVNWQLTTFGIYKQNRNLSCYVLRKQTLLFNLIDVVNYVSHAIPQHIIPFHSYLTSLRKATLAQTPLGFSWVNMR